MLPIYNVSTSFKILATLGTENTRPSAAAQCVAYAAVTELPVGQWPDLISVLVSNVVNSNSTEMLQESTLECMDYISQNIEHEVLASQSNHILTAIIHGMRQSEPSNHVRLAATTALYNSLEFTKANFDKESERNFIMEVVCEATQDTQVREAALQCLVKIMTLYYQYMEPYMAPALYPITLDAMNSDTVEVSLQGIEFWSNIADKFLRTHGDGIYYEWDQFRESFPVVAEWVPENNGLRSSLVALSNLKPYNMAHNAEADACDLLLEMERLNLLDKKIDENVYPTACMSVSSCVPYVPVPKNTSLIETYLKLYRCFEQYPQAMRVAMQLNDIQLIEEIFTSCPDLTTPGTLARSLIEDGGNRTLSLEVKRRIRLEGAELEEYMKREKENKNGKHEPRDPVDSSDESEDEMDSPSAIKGKHDLLVKTEVKMQTSFFKTNKRQYPMFPFYDEKVKFDEYGEIIRSKQLAFMPGRQQGLWKLDENMIKYDDLVEIMYNAHINNPFLNVGREMQAPPMPAPPHMPPFRPHHHGRPNHYVNNKRQPEPPSGPPVTVFVGNITERSPDAMIRHILAACGPVISWKRVQAFGFCEFGSPDAGLRAMRLLHDFDIGDKKLVVKVDAKTKTVLDEYKGERLKKLKGSPLQDEVPDDDDDYIDDAMKLSDKATVDRIYMILNDYRSDMTNFIATPDQDRTKTENKDKISKTQEKLIKLSQAQGAPQDLSIYPSDSRMTKEEYLEILKAVKGDTKEKVLVSQFIVKFFRHFPDLAEQAIEALFDLCKDEDCAIRRQAIKDLPAVCKADIQHTSKITDILAQLLQTTDSTELSVVNSSLITCLKMDAKGALTGIFQQILSGEELVRERCIKFINLKVKSLGHDIMNKDVEDHLITNLKKVLQDVTSDEFHSIIDILAWTRLGQTVSGQKELVDLVSEQAELGQDFDPSDLESDHVYRLIQCCKTALPYFSSQVSSLRFVSYICDQVLPEFDKIISSEDGANPQLDILKLFAELCSHCGVLEDPESKVKKIFERLLDYMPLPPEVGDDTTPRNEPRIEFTHIECLMYALHKLGKQCPDFLTKDADRLKDFKIRLQYLARETQGYIKKLKEALHGKIEEELKSDENKIKVVALKTTSNINTIIKDLFHNPPSFKSIISLSWKFVRPKLLGGAREDTEKDEDNKQKDEDSTKKEQEDEPEHKLSKIDINNASGIKGLDNPTGRICYANSCIQSIVCLPQFQSFFFKGSYKECKLIKCDGSVLNELMDLFTKFWTIKGDKVLTVMQLKSAIDQQTTDFPNDRQQDVADFATYLLNVLEKEINEQKKKSGIETRNFITYILEGSVMTIKSCTHGHFSFDDSPYKVLEIPVIDDTTEWSLMELIEEFTKEKIVHEKCDDCNDVSMKCKVVFNSFPEVLFIYISRLEISSDRKPRRIKTRVQPDINLILSNEFENYDYSLKSVVLHYGNEEGGHYVATTYHHDSKEWVCYNDDNFEVEDFGNMSLENTVFFAYIRN